MRRLGPRSAALRAGKRGAAFVWFCLVAIPVLFFALAMAVDFTRVILAGRQVGTATQAAAIAGAYQFKPGVAELDTGAAASVAADTYCWSAEVGGTPLVRTDSTDSCSGAKASARLEVLATSSSVRVTAHYQVKGLLVMDFFTSGGYHPPEVTREATICSSQDPTGPTGGNCYRPQN